MSGPRLFNRMRDGLAPLLRPVLERIGPIRRMGLWWLARRHPDTVELEGQSFRVDPRDFGVTLELHSTGTYEPFARGVCLDGLEPGMVFLDVGAHVGLYSLPSARKVGPEGRVISFEPHPGNRSLLCSNVEANGLQNVTVVPAAVADAEGEMTLQISGFNTGDHRLFRGTRNADGVPVVVVTIDQYCETAGIQEVDLVKIDVQGAEAKVLAGMSAVISQSPNMRIIMEYTPWMLRSAGDEPSRLLADLDDAGFDLFILDEAGATCVPATPAEIDAACPGRSYVNLLATRKAISS